MNLVDSLKRYTTVVADTGDVEAIAKHKPQDATTNPSLSYRRPRCPSMSLSWKGLFSTPCSPAATGPHGPRPSWTSCCVSFGCEILKIVPGRVSTEVDAGLSFDTEGTLVKAHRLIGTVPKGRHRSRAYSHQDRQHLGRNSGGRKARTEGIHCNLTLLFSFAQAVACAEAGVTLVSPFVGRIYDWYKKERGGDIPADEDPGVPSMTRIYNYFKKFDYKTQIIGASFRKVDQIVRLAGCDLLTISPDLLEKLQKTEGTLTAGSRRENAKASKTEKIHLDEKTFRWMHNEDAMAVEKLSEGIRHFYVHAPANSKSLLGPR